MDILGMAPLEILLVLVIFFLLFGPEKLPGMARTLGKMIARLKQSSEQFKRTLTDEIKAADVSKEVASAIKDEAKEFKDFKAISDVAQEIKKDVSGQSIPRN